MIRADRPQQRYPAEKDRIMEVNLFLTLSILYIYFKLTVIILVLVNTSTNKQNYNFCYHESSFHNFLIVSQLFIVSPNYNIFLKDFLTFSASKLDL